jgi:hypothetical protein
MMCWREASPRQPSSSLCRDPALEDERSRAAMDMQLVTIDRGEEQQSGNAPVAPLVIS